MKIPTFLLGTRAKLIGAGLAALALFVAGWTINGWRLGMTLAQERAGRALDAKAASEAARVAERSAGLSGAVIAARVVESLNAREAEKGQQEGVIRNEIVKVPVYSQCLITPVVRDTINSAVATANSTASGVAAKAN